MTTPERAYLSIIEWPEAADERWRAEALAVAGDLDPHQAVLTARQATPCIAALIDAGARAPRLHRLRELGIVATAPTRAELARLPEPVMAKRLAEAIGSDGRLYMVEPWRGEGEGLRTADIRLLVRASIRVSKTTVSSDPTAGRSAAYGYMGLGAEGAVIAGGADAQEHHAKRSTKATVTEVLDIYTAEKRRIRVNADKFSFDCLGPSRTYGDKPNLDALTVKLAELAPKAYIDQGFAQFRPPADIQLRSRHSAGSVRSRNDTHAFEFYSPWFAVAYSVLLKSAKH